MNLIMTQNLFWRLDLRLLELLSGAYRSVNSAAVTACSDLLESLHLHYEAFNGYFGFFFGLITYVFIHSGIASIISDN